LESDLTCDLGDGESGHEVIVEAGADVSPVPGCS
jgi:hypothetical protein